MRPDLETLQAACPELERAAIEQHLRRLDAPYFERFDAAEVAAHLAGLATLGPQHPVEVLSAWQDGGSAACTVLASDYPFAFSLITGVLAGMGFGVVSGDVFTYARSARAPTRPDRRRRSRGTLPPPPDRRRIIDRFQGIVDLRDTTPEDWQRELTQRLERVFGLLEQGSGEAVTEAKHAVNEMVTRRLAQAKRSGLPVLFPVEIAVHNDVGPRTTVQVVSQDTPAFLYALSTALSLHGLSIEHVAIRTIGRRIEDTLELTDAGGAQISDPKVLDRIRLSILLTKQFTYFLDRAPDPYTALGRFETLVRDILELPDSSRWVEGLSDPHTMQHLARLLGASDYLWEDFIRLQYETLLPLLQGDTPTLAQASNEPDYRRRLGRLLEGVDDLQERRRALNEFKDRELFLIDLGHILDPATDFRAFAARLTRLAEAVVDCASASVFADLAGQYGRPLTVAGLEAQFCVMGLGKLGGAALGYASDIELLFVYSDHGQTDGARSIDNGEFFSRLARQTARFIEAKQEGIFRVDLRLRPHGDSGQPSCSLESFCGYYGPGGPAHSYERLALVRMRFVAGHPELGSRLERLRDEYVYASPCVVPAELRELRARQFREKNEPGRYNAKFSPGALVDLEYAVQILQVMYAKNVEALRTPRIHQALQGLRAARILDPEESDRLVASYEFLRRLINGLRMLRGSARDLFLPAEDSEEFLHLARRMGYRGGDDLEPSQELRLEFETRTAAVRAFVERHFGRASLPGPTRGNIADLVLSDAPAAELAEEILSQAGFHNIARARTNLRSMAGHGGQRDLFAKLAVLAGDFLRHEPDPDMALNNWERFVHACEEPTAAYREMLAQPRRLQILLGIFSRSQFLADTLIRIPEFWDWVTARDNLHREGRPDRLRQELQACSEARPDPRDWLNALRRVKHREMLRIGARDMVLQVPIQSVIRDLSVLADGCLEAVLRRVWQQLQAEGRLPSQAGEPTARFALMAFGKLGGRELNYSSDIDIMGVFDGAVGTEEAEVFGLVLERVRADLSRHTEEGHAFRVDLRLRPYGGAGELVPSIDGLEDYYRRRASPWEVQALLKLRAVAGDPRVGDEVLKRLKPLLRQPRTLEDIAASIRDMRQAARQPLADVTDVKTGLGGIRDVEFLVQALQLLHAHEHGEAVLSGNTLDALEALGRCGILTAGDVQQLSEDYILLRRVEHYLQILENRQIHAIPSRPEELAALAKRMLGPEAGPEAFRQQLDACLQRVHQRHTALLG